MSAEKPTEVEPGAPLTVSQRAVKAFDRVSWAKSALPAAGSVSGVSFLTAIWVPGETAPVRMFLTGVLFMVLAFIAWLAAW